VTIRKRGFLPIEWQKKVSSHDDAHGKLQLSQRNGFQLVRLPYGKGNVVIDLLLPDKSKSLADMLPVLIKLGNQLELNMSKTVAGDG